MKQFLLALLTSPALIGSAFCYLSVLPPVHATEPTGLTPESQVCVWSTHSRSNLICTQVKNLAKLEKKQLINLADNPRESPDVFEFSDSESNAAVALFGCDCPVCINALRQLRLMAQTG